MLDSFYRYDLVHRSKARDFNPAIHCRVYRFKTPSGRRYHVELDFLPENFCVIKFYPIDRKRARNRYQCILNDGFALGVIGTCIKILLDYIHENPRTSFGFMGVPKSKHANDKFSVGDFDNTSRYKIYLHAVVNRLGSKTFLFEKDERISSFCAINRAQDSKELRAVIKNAFEFMITDLNASVNFTNLQT
jgi:hypothetical protein